MVKIVSNDYFKNLINYESLNILKEKINNVKKHIKIWKDTLDCKLTYEEIQRKYLKEM
jgi:hypothetical protein